MKILIASGSGYTRRGLKAILGDNTDVSYIGESADAGGTLQQLKTTPYDAVLIDYGSMIWTA